MLHAIKNFRITVFLVLFSISAGCTIVPPKPDKEVEQQAIAFQQAGNPLAAAEEYMQLAQEYDYYAEYFYIKAARNYFVANATDMSENTLKKLRPEKLDAIQKFESQILISRIHLSRDDALLALHILKAEVPADAPAELKAEYHITKSIAYEKDNQALNAFQERIKYSPFISKEEDKINNRKRIWQLIANTELTALEEALQTADRKSDLAGWLELGIISKTSLYNLPILESSIISWEKRYPKHPASKETVQIILALGKEVNQLPKQIALLLPLSKQYRDFSNAIQDGFLAAWYNASGKKPALRIYDSSQGNITDIYQKAVEEGAEFIVGPLEKESIKDLLTSDTVTTKTLTLNRISTDESISTQRPGTDITPMIYQFGLVPEDEANQIAGQILLDGHSNALIVTPDNSWGDRIFDAFSSNWLKLGGTIINHVKIFDTSRNYAIPIEQLLNITESKKRARDLMTTLGRKLNFEPRPRQDADVIFIAATAEMARQLMPQLRFYGAGDIDTYSISNVFTGIYAPSKDSDIDGVIFTDMPWVVDPEYQSSLLQQQLNQTWQQDNSPYRRLFALGIDAYQIIPFLGSLYIQGNSYAGNTGSLVIDNYGHVTRQSVLARFVKGVPVKIQR